MRHIGEEADTANGSYFERGFLNHFMDLVIALVLAFNPGHYHSDWRFISPGTRLKTTSTAKTKVMRRVLTVGKRLLF